MGNLEDAPNIGKVLAACLREVGISDIDELKKVGSKEAFIRICEKDPTACFCKLCALEGATENIRWHNLDPKTKDELRNFFQGVKGKGKN